MARSVGCPSGPDAQAVPGTEAKHDGHGLSALLGRLLIMALFDQFVRTDHRPAYRSESDYEFMNLSAWPAYENIRNVLERWFADYPASHKGDLSARFRKSDQNHAAAYFELYLYQILSRLGLSPEVHPDRGSGRGRPDFAIVGANGSRCYVEAHVVFKTRWSSDDPLENEHLDAIDDVAELQPTRIGVAVSTKGSLQRSHPKDPIQREVREWLDSIDPVGQLTPADFDRNPRLCIQRDDWVAELKAFGLLSHPSRRLIQMGPTRAGFSDEGPLLADSLKRKVKTYSKLDHGLILAINTNGVFTSGEDEHAALLGTESGIWRIDSTARHQRLQGVLFFRDLVPSNMHNVVYGLYMNPSIQADIPEELLKLNSKQHSNGEWHLKKGMSLGKLLGLPEDWPGEVTAFW